MTSWIREPPKKPIEKNSFLFETTEAGFCSQFNNYFYSALYAMSSKLPLYVNDTVNAVSIHYPLIKNTFVPLTNLTFTDTTVVSATSLIKKSGAQKVAGTLLAFLNNLEKSRFRQMAREILVWNPALLEKIKRLDTSANIDLGIHMRGGDKIVTGESANISVDTYINAARKYQRDSGKTTLTIFVMTDSSQRLEEFKRKKDASWTIVTIRYPPDLIGHTQRDFNAATSQKRMTGYLEFIRELVVMQSAPHIICTFSSNIGRFLYLTADDTTTVVSVDMPVFTPI
jgi:hypothetical protein